MSRVHSGGFFALACALGVLASAASVAQTQATQKQYTFGLHTLNQPETVRRRQVQFNIDNGMTEDELDAVNHVLDARGATPVDGEGYRSASLPNGAHVRIGGFLVEGFLEDSTEGVHSLPVELAVDGELATPEAALLLQIMKAGNLFVGSSADADRVATATEVKDKRFTKAHKQIAVTPDENALAQWLRQNTAPR
jgi:hypothetical protein